MLGTFSAGAYSIIGTPRLQLGAVKLDLAAELFRKMTRTWYSSTIVFVVRGTCPEPMQQVEHNLVWCSGVAP